MNNDRTVCSILITVNGKQVSNVIEISVFAKSSMHEIRTIRVMASKKRFIRNYQLTKAIDLVLEFGKWCGIVLRNNEEYGDHTYSKSQLTKMLVMNTLTFITGIRFLLTAAIAKEWIVVLMSDSLYMLSVSKEIDNITVRLAAFMLGMTPMIIMMISLILLRRELDGTSELMAFFYDYEFGKLIPMNQRNASSLERETYWLAKFTKPFFSIIAAILLAILPGLNILAYFIGPIEFYFISVLFWSICSVAFIVQLAGIVCIGAFGWIIPVHYLLIKFREITIKFSRISDYNETKIITNHSIICEKTKAMNDFFRFV